MTTDRPNGARIDRQSLAADDIRLGQVTRALRRRLDLRQEDVARLARCSRRTVARIEAGEAGRVTGDVLRSVVAALGARVRTSAWWNGAALDRILDERHAALVERAIAVLRSRGWETAAEVTFSTYGERGSIDVMAGRAAKRSLLVCEVKTAFGSLEETHRSLDAKERLAPALCRERFDWSPTTTSRILILPDDRTLRRVVDRHALTMASVYPARSREVRRWLREPAGRMRGIWFLSEGHHAATVIGG